MPALLAAVAVIVVIGVAVDYLVFNRWTGGSAPAAGC